MPDDLDNQLRVAMKVLDEQTPSGYFDAAPNQILARLEDGSMQQQGPGTSNIGMKRDVNALMGPPVVPEDADTNPTPKVEASEVGPLPSKPVAAAAAVATAPAPAPAAEPVASTAAARDEDSGLHDIRNLAQSTKQRLSARRITAAPPIADDHLASSSGSFANIALPQPAKMVALPDLEDLPSKQEVIAAQKAAAKARKEKKPTIDPTLASKDVLAPQATANAALAAMSATPIADAAESAVPVRQAFTLPSMERKKSKGPLIAVLGLGVAAAAGGLIFMSSNKEEKAPQVAAATDSAQTAPTPTAAPIEAAGSAAAAEPPAPPPAPVEEVAPEQVAAAAVPAVADDEDEAKDEPKGRSKRAPKAAKKDTEEKKVEEPKVEKVEAPKEIKTPDGTKKATTGEGEPSFDALLKEAGVEDKKDAKPKLEKKSLTGDDFKKGMASIESKAQGCYKGTQGTASVKLTIGPTGKVTKASVGGQFAGKPEGACVEAAVKGATFPAWDGGPQSFNYSYMLAD